jgi:hypothetical protein
MAADQASKRSQNEFAFMVVTWLMGFSMRLTIERGAGREKV